MTAPALAARARGGLKPAALAGWGTLALLGAFALLVPLLMAGDHASQNLLATLLPPGQGHLLGTDHFGRDMALRLAEAIRVSAGVALVSVAVALLFGVAGGLFAARLGGWADRIISALADMTLALPGLLLVLMVVAIAPGSFLSLYIGISLILWVEYFRLTRAIAARAYASPAVEAARLLGFGPLYIFRNYIWPVLAPVLLASAAFGAANAILAVAALGFVNVGVRPPTPELGQMMVELMPYYQEAPLQLLQPVAVVFLLVLSLNLIAGGRDEA